MESKWAVSLLCWTLAAAFRLQAGGVGPALLEVNLGVVPIDRYTLANSDNGSAILPGCRNAAGVQQLAWTIKQCYQSMIADSPGDKWNPVNYRRQAR